MAKVTIVVQDIDDSLDVTAEFDPPANNGTDPDTPAQFTAKALLLALSEAQEWDVAEAIHGTTD